MNRISEVVTANAFKMAPKWKVEDRKSLSESDGNETEKRRRKKIKNVGSIIEEKMNIKMKDLKE